MTDEKGQLTCISDVSLSVWDGSDEEVLVKEGETLPITYFEYTGSIGLMSAAGKELYCSNDERRKYFK